MRFTIAILLLFNLSYSKDIDKNINYKLILSYDKNITEVQKRLLKLENYFRDNEENSIFKKRYNLKFDIEKIGNFYIVVIKPIDSIDIRNKLLILLNHRYIDIFAIEYENIEDKKEIEDRRDRDILVEDIEIEDIEIDDDLDIEEIEIANELYDEDIDELEILPPYIVEEKSWLDAIGLQWIAIFLLALFGLISSIYNRKKLLKIEKRQESLTSHQNKIESEITNLGVEKNV